MKKLSILLVMLLCISANIFAQGQYFAVENSDGKTICYKITSSSAPKTAEVSNTSYIVGDNEYTGVINIPDTVTHSGSTYSRQYTVTGIGSRAFCNCPGLTGVTIPESVTYIDSRAFSGCTGLTSFTIPNNITRIESSTFSGCTGLTSITIPNSITYIGNQAFQECTGLTSITIPNSVTTLGGYAFAYCTGLTSITIPNSVTIIGIATFRKCSGLTSVTIPNSVTTIADMAFEFCSGLTSITIPNSVTLISNYAFSGCSGLTSITIPDSVTIIGRNAFKDSPIATVIMKPLNPPTMEEDADAAFDINTLNVIYVPCGCEDVYKSAPGWCYYADKIQEDCSAIEEVAEETGIAVYPNPVMDNAVLSIDNLKEDVKVILTDEQGREISLSTMKAGEREINLNTSSLANGIYFVRIVGETIQRTEKIIKK